MPKLSMRLLAAACLLAALGRTPAADSDPAPPTTGRDLVGAWRLVSIDVQGPSGPELDPFYGEGTQGLLIYDATGWFSVQFMGAARPKLEVPDTRPERTADTHTAIKAAALDSYYAYYGTWEFDPSTSTVTHHSKGALYPDETGATYRQHVEVKGVTMTFRRSQGDRNHPTIQIKTWEKLPRP